MFYENPDWWKPLIDENQYVFEKVKTYIQQDIYGRVILGGQEILIVVVTCMLVTKRFNIWDGYAFGVYLVKTKHV